MCSLQWQLQADSLKKQSHNQHLSSLHRLDDEDLSALRPPLITGNGAPPLHSKFRGLMEIADRSTQRSPSVQETEWSGSAHDSPPLHSNRTPTPESGAFRGGTPSDQTPILPIFYFCFVISISHNFESYLYDFSFNIFKR